jgi:putative redox protein
MKITTKMLGDEVFEGMNEFGNTVKIDMRKGRDKVNLSPTEMVLSALAGCSAVDVVAMLRKRKKSIEELIIETDGTKHEPAPHYFTKIHVTFILTSTDATEDELQKISALALEKYCSVASSLKAEITFSVKVKRP